MFVFVSTFILISTVFLTRESSTCTINNTKHVASLTVSRTEKFNNNEVLHVAGLVLARCGSKGIYRKNLARIGNTTLLRRTLSTMQAFGRFTTIWVSTDCNEIAQEALLSGALVFCRSTESATDIAQSITAVHEFAVFHPEVDVIGLVQCTSPYLATPFLHSAHTLITQNHFDSVFSVSRQHKLRWKLLPDGRAKALNFNPKRRPRRQDWEGELIENGMFYFVRRHLVIRKLLQGGRIGIVEVPSNCSLEIDSPLDLRLANEYSGFLRARAGT